jgi:SAM-dependent methyltransferase
VTYFPPYFDFYVNTFENLLSRGIVAKEMSVLVVCGGETDREVFKRLGFTNVTITNVDYQWAEEDMAPFRWEPQDAENLKYPDNSFDVAVVCAGLHHCHSPHRALLELFRISRRCAIALEARDSLLSKIAERLKVADEYELSGVVENGYLYGGVKNTPIPNFVYRWTEREVSKTIASYAPWSRPKIIWYHGFAPPVGLLKGRKNVLALLIMYGAYPILWVLTKLIKNQGNLFAFAILKPELSTELHPWLVMKDGVPEINPEWVEKNFKKGNESL